MTNHDINYLDWVDFPQGRVRYESGFRGGMN